MENPITCPACHINVRPTDFFCFNCGKNLKPKPITMERQILLILGSLLLPPLGIIWGMRLLKEVDQKSKLTGIVCIGLTVISLVITIILSINVVNSFNQELNKQLNQAWF